MSHAKKPRPAPAEPDQAEPVIRLSFDPESSNVIARLLPGDHKGEGITLPRALRGLAKVLEDLEPTAAPPTE